MIKPETIDFIQSWFGLHAALRDRLRSEHPVVSERPEISFQISPGSVEESFAVRQEPTNRVGFGIVVRETTIRVQIRRLNETREWTADCWEQWDTCVQEAVGWLKLPRPC